MFWREQNLTYEILIPPLDKPFCQLSKREAQTYFDWYLSKQGERITYLKSASKLNLDYSVESLIPLWRWFLRQAKVEITPKIQLEELEAKLRAENSPFINEVLEDHKKQLSLQTEYILQDIARYFGEVYIRYHPSVYWGFYTRPKNEVSVNQPVLMGIPNAVYPDKPGTPRPVLQMVRVCALRLLSGDESRYDLYHLFERNRFYTEDCNCSTGDGTVCE